MYFQYSCKAAVATMPSFEKLALHVNVVCVSADAFAKVLQEKGPSSVEARSTALQDAILKAALPYYTELKAFCEKQTPPMEIPRAVAPWLDFTAVAVGGPTNKDQRGNKDETTSKLLPKVIEFS